MNLSIFDIVWTLLLYINYCVGTIQIFIQQHIFNIEFLHTILYFVLINLFISNYGVWTTTKQKKNTGKILVYIVYACNEFC